MTFLSLNSKSSTTSDSSQLSINNQTSIILEDSPPVGKKPAARTTQTSLPATEAPVLKRKHSKKLAIPSDSATVPKSPGFSNLQNTAMKAKNPATLGTPDLPKKLKTMIPTTIPSVTNTTPALESSPALELSDCINTKKTESLLESSSCINTKKTENLVPSNKIMPKSQNAEMFSTIETQPVSAKSENSDKPKTLSSAATHPTAPDFPACINLKNNVKTAAIEIPETVETPNISALIASKNAATLVKNAIGIPEIIDTPNLPTCINLANPANVEKNATKIPETIDTPNLPTCIDLANPTTLKKNAIGIPETNDPPNLPACIDLTNPANLENNAIQIPETIKTPVNPSTDLTKCSTQPEIDPLQLVQPDQAKTIDGSAEDLSASAC
ncbi:hypothetical protein PtA15_7A238 [Puccinia triticina]|uniref:Uncharacterized protein n=1 Tax=Puccinia triticina TaxID=208348 RepID=A0ABY7CPV6_9BASI|nr:uncharacterized protein PtA15_7A238 [Puccinia triticina]WAQ86512.1 hypothetical protein PtA15_7A238 [Puccinia triticina]